MDNINIYEYMREQALKVKDVPLDQQVKLIFTINNKDIGSTDILNKHVQTSRWDVIARGLERIESEHREIIKNLKKERLIFRIEKFEENK